MDICCMSLYHLPLMNKNGLHSNLVDYTMQRSALTINTILRPESTYVVGYNRLDHK